MLADISWPSFVIGVPQLLNLDKSPTARPTGLSANVVAFALTGDPRSRVKVGEPAVDMRDLGIDPPVAA